MSKLGGKLRPLLYIWWALETNVGVWFSDPRTVAHLAASNRRGGSGPVLAWLDALVGWSISREQRVRFSYRFPLLLIALVLAVWLLVPCRG